MRILVTSLIAIISALHLYIAWFEIFAWETRGPKVFSSIPAQLFGQTVSMAANQGIYNAFLAAGLIWSLFITEPTWKSRIATCFLIFVAIAGIFGAITVSTRILYVQAVPAVITLVLLFFYERGRLRMSDAKGSSAR